MFTPYGQSVIQLTAQSGYKHLLSFHCSQDMNQVLLDYTVVVTHTLTRILRNGCSFMLLQDRETLRAFINLNCIVSEV